MIKRKKKLFYCNNINFSNVAATKYIYAYSDSLDSIPPEGFKFDDPKLNDGSGRNLKGVTLLPWCAVLASELVSVSLNAPRLNTSFPSGEFSFDLDRSGDNLNLI